MSAPTTHHEPRRRLEERLAHTRVQLQESRILLGEQQRPDRENLQHLIDHLAQVNQELSRINENLADGLPKSDPVYGSLQAANERLYFVLNNIVQAYFVLDREWRFQEINQAGASMLDRTVEELMGKNIWEQFPAAVGKEFYRQYHTALAENHPVHFEAQSTSTGGWYEVHAYPHNDCLEVYYRDISDRKAVEQALESAARFPGENPNPVLRISEEGKVLYANLPAERLLGSFDWESGSPAPDILYRPVHAALVENSLKMIDLESGEITYALTLAPFIAEGFVNLYAIDITSRRRAEDAIKQYAAELERRNRDLQSFALIASHDMQEPLRKIQVFGDRLQRDYRDRLDDVGRDYLDRMGKAAHRMQLMIKDLLAYSRIYNQVNPYIRVDLNQVVAEILVDLEGLIESTSGRVEVLDLPALEADPVQIRQLFQNLIANGLKFHQPDVPPVVTISSENVPPGSVKILVQDNGIGFNQENAERIFQPFHRLVGPGEYEGSGIGLAISRKITERHKGSITAWSRPGAGTAFIVTLPLYQTD